MDKFISNFNAFLGTMTASVLQISTPIMVLAAIVSIVMYAIASQQNREKYKLAVIGIIVAAVLVVSVPYIIPWIQQQFKDTTTETTYILNKWRF